MAATTIERNHALAPRVWARVLALEALHACEADRLVGEDSGSIIQMRDELTKTAGDRLTIGLRTQLDGDGQIGTATLKGNEEELDFLSDDLYIDNQRHAVKIKGVISQQRVLFDLRSEAKSGLVDWWKKRVDIGLLNQLAGNTAQTSLKYTANNAVTAPDAAHKIYGGGATASNQLTDVSFGFDITMIDKMVFLAETLPTPIRKANYGESYEGYCLELHPTQILQMRTNMSQGQWNEIQLAAMKGGEITKNPIFTGADGYYNGVVIRKDARVPWGDNSQGNAMHHTDLGTPGAGKTNVARGIFMGAQAAGIAFGRAGGRPEKFRWVEALDDYEDEYGVAASMIWGAKKMIFNAKDFSVITCETFSPAVN